MGLDFLISLSSSSKPVVFGLALVRGPAAFWSGSVEVPVGGGGGAVADAANLFTQ